jgi:hypothetical protein
MFLLFYLDRVRTSGTASRGKPAVVFFWRLLIRFNRTASAEPDEPVIIVPGVKNGIAPLPDGDVSLQLRCQAHNSGAGRLTFDNAKTRSKHARPDRSGRFVDPRPRIIISNARRRARKPLDLSRSPELIE